MKSCRANNSSPRCHLPVIKSSNASSPRQMMNSVSGCSFRNIAMSADVVPGFAPASRPLAARASPRDTTTRASPENEVSLAGAKASSKRPFASSTTASSNANPHIVNLTSYDVVPPVILFLFSAYACSYTGTRSTSSARLRPRRSSTREARAPRSRARHHPSEDRRIIRTRWCAADPNASTLAWVEVRRRRCDDTVRHRDRRDGAGRARRPRSSSPSRRAASNQLEERASRLVVPHESDPTPRARVNARATDDESSLGRLMG